MHLEYLDGVIFINGHALAVVQQAQMHDPDAMEALRIFEKALNAKTLEAQTDGDPEVSMSSPLVPTIEALLTELETLVWQENKVGFIPVSAVMTWIRTQKETLHND